MHLPHFLSPLLSEKVTLLKYANLTIDRQCHLKYHALAGICGKDTESPKSKGKSTKATETDANSPEDEHRIVGGWDAPAARPFKVLVRAVNPNDAEDYETCGGAILNRSMMRETWHNSGSKFLTTSVISLIRRFVVTAAHCVCLRGDGSGIVECEDGEIKYNAGEVIRVFVGLNTQDINVATERHGALHEKQVEEVRNSGKINMNR